MTDRSNAEAEALRELCRGREPDADWTADENGNWVPGISDRRRIAVAKLFVSASIFGEVVPFALVSKTLQEQSTDEEDLIKLVKSCHDYVNKGNKGPVGP